MPRETHAPGPKTRATPLQRYISTLLTCKVTLVDGQYSGIRAPTDTTSLWKLL